MDAARRRPRGRRHHAARAPWTRRADRDPAPTSLPLPVRVFVLWLAVLLWKREQDAAAAAS